MRQLRVHLLVVGTLAALLIPAAVAAARSVSPDAGSVTLKLSAVARGRLDGVNITVSGRSARVSGGLWSFDRLADDGGGTLRTRGRLRFRRGRLKVDISDLRISLARDSGSGRYINGRLSGRIGKVRYPLGVLVSRTYRSSPGRFDNLELIISPAVAGNLNRALGVPGFSAADSFGRFSGRKISKMLRFNGGRTRLSVSAEMHQAFANAGASITALPGAGGAGVAANPFTLPVTGRTLDLVTLKGAITVGGGLRFTAPQGGSFGGRNVIDAAAARITASEDGYLITTGAGLELFSAIEDPDTSLDRTSTSYRHTGLALQFTHPAAELIAPALGMTGPQLIALPKGRLDIDGTLARR